MYGEIGSPEEHFFISTVYKNYLEKEIKETPNLSNDATTFTNWPNMNYKYVFRPNIGDRMPKHYNEISDEELEYLINSKCLFGRKFTKECFNSLNVELYNKEVLCKNINYNLSFKLKLEESEKIDKNLGRIMRQIYNLNSIS